MLKLYHAPTQRPICRSCARPDKLHHRPRKVLMQSRWARSVTPNPEEFVRGAHYYFEIGNTSDAPGWIFAEPETASFRLHYRTEPRRSAYSPSNLFRKPDFLVLDHQNQEVLRISRYTRVPACFNIIQNGEVVGTIGLRSLLRNKYSLELKDGPTWTFRMPLFTIQFDGESNANSRVWVRLCPSKRQWNLLTQVGADDLRLLAGLAFIHREWWCYS